MAASVNRQLAPIRMEEIRPGLYRFWKPDGTTLKKTACLKMGLGHGSCCASCAAGKGCEGKVGTGDSGVQQVAINWNPLPSGQDIEVRNGYAYAAVASIKKTRSQADIVSFLKGYNLTVSQFAEQGPDHPEIQTDPDPDYRTVALITDVAEADGGSIPWQVPALLPGRDHAIAAWAGQVDGSALPAVPPRRPSSGVGVVLGLVAAAGAAAGVAYAVHRYKVRHA